MARASVTFPLAFPPARPRPLDGEVELRLAAAVRHGSRPRRVTAFLCEAYDTVGGETCDRVLARRLSAAAREALLQAAALRFHPGLSWFETACPSCGEHYDVNVAVAEAPRKAAGAGFPVAEIETSLGRRSFEAPNGGHEETIAQRCLVDPGLDIRRAFAALCSLGDEADAEAQAFDDADLAAIDGALEALCPDIADETQSRCPACGAAAAARIEPFGFAVPREGEVLQGVHRLARAYGWGEAEILKLSSARRRSYEAFIAADERQGSSWRGRP